MQDPSSNPNFNPNPHNANSASQLPPPPSTAAVTSPSSSFFIRSGGNSGSIHRRAHSEVSFRLPDDMMDLSPSDPFNGGPSTASFDEIGSEDDLFSTYIDVDKLGGWNGSGGYGDSSEKNPNVRPRHRHSSSVDGSTSSFGEIMDAKKAMPPLSFGQLIPNAPRDCVVSIEYLRIGNLLLVQKRERLAIYKNLSAKFRPFRLKPQHCLPN